MTPEELEAMRECVEATTEGPWEDRTDDLTDEVYVVHDREQVLFVASCGGKEDPRVSADAVFISTARTNVPRLLAEVERLRSVCDELTRAYNLAADRFMDVTATANRLQARLAKVRALHQPERFSPGGSIHCTTCGKVEAGGVYLGQWPCPTIQAIDGCVH